MNENVEHPEHYNEGEIECIDAMIAARGIYEVLPFCICNAFKYIWRAGYKEGNKPQQDVEKAIWYLNKYLELLKSK